MNPPKPPPPSTSGYAEGLLERAVGLLNNWLAGGGAYDATAAFLREIRRRAIRAEAAEQQTGCVCPFPRERCPRCALPCRVCDAAMLAAPSQDRKDGDHHE